MTELKDDLDRALRSVTFGEAPVERMIRDGRRLRNRRRLTVLAGRRRDRGGRGRATPR